MALVPCSINLGTSCQQKERCKTAPELLGLCFFSWPNLKRELAEDGHAEFKLGDSAPGLLEPPWSSSVLRPSLFSLAHPPLHLLHQSQRALNRLLPRGVTNLWLGSPKITRDPSRALCVKLTGTCKSLTKMHHQLNGGEKKRGGAFLFSVSLPYSLPPIYKKSQWLKKRTLSESVLLFLVP